MIKKLVLLTFVLSLSMSTSSCASDDDCGTKNVSGVQRNLIKGPEGGCYYVNSNGNKTYVDRSECQC